VSEQKPERPLWRFRTHRDHEPMHLTRADDEYLALCGYSFKRVQSSATINPHLHDENHLRCADCVAASP
jgi:hypothetical protein